MPKRRTKTKKGCKTLLNKSKKIFSNYTKLHNKYISKLKTIKDKFNNNVDRVRSQVDKHMDKLDVCLETYPDIKSEVYKHFNVMKNEIEDLQKNNSEIIYLME
jgi:uncharacterized phage infection (PIP) family protein YhgE